MPATATSPLRPLRNRAFLAYWLTGLMANFGWLIQLVGASWLMASIGGSAELVALVQTTIALPVMLFSLLAGALADSLGRRAMIIWSQAFLLAVSVLLAWVAWTGAVTPWMLLGFTFLIGTGKALNNPAWQTYVNEFMARDELPEAIALNSMGFNIARSVGPAIGGALVAGVGAFAAFAVSAASNIGMILVMLAQRPRIPARSELPPEALGSAMMAGLRYVAMSPNLLVVLLRASIFNLAAISVMALLPLVARDLVAGGPQTYGALLGAFGVGAVAGAFAGPWLRRALALEGQVQAGFLLSAAATMVVALSGSMALTMLASGAAGACWLLTLATLNTTIQMSSPRWVVGRSLALYQAAAFGGNALGSWIWGVVAVHHGLPASLCLSAGLLVVGALVGLRLPLWVPAATLDPQTRWVAPQPVIDMLPRSGPVKTTIEYVIETADVPAFLALMAERKQNRQRDGARRWSLSQDIQDPRIWIEQYQTATWTETLRYHQRRTVTDSELAQRIHTLHRGGRPAVRHQLERVVNRPDAFPGVTADH